MLKELKNIYIIISELRKYEQIKHILCMNYNDINGKKRHSHDQIPQYFITTKSALNLAC